MVSAVFGKVSFVSLLAAVFGISAKGEMFYNVGNFINFGVFGIAHTGAKLEFRVHNASVGDVNQKSLGTRS